MRKFVAFVEYSLFGLNPEQFYEDPESKKLDATKGGKDIGDPPTPETIPKEDKKTEQVTKEYGLKIMTPKQMITRLPILLAQLKAGNNSQKLKNEIRYNYLIDSI